jgi:hypothetical protein
MSCCGDCAPAEGWSTPSLTACVRATRAARPTQIVSPSGVEQALAGDWIVRIPALNMTSVLSDTQFRAAFTFKADHAV